MIETLHLLPPDLGPRSNPVLYGVAAALAERFPPVVLAPRPCEVASRQAFGSEPAGDDEAGRAPARRDGREAL